MYALNRVILYDKVHGRSSWGLPRMRMVPSTAWQHAVWRVRHERESTAHAASKADEGLKLGLSIA